MVLSLFRLHTIEFHEGPLVFGGQMVVESGKDRYNCDWFVDIRRRTT